jgi:hypothetical protein
MVTAGVAVARWNLTVRPRTLHKDLSILNGNRRTGLLPEPGLVSPPVVGEGELVVADQRCGRPWTEIADVIVRPHPP